MKGSHGDSVSVGRSDGSRAGHLGGWNAAEEQEPFQQLSCDEESKGSGQQDEAAQDRRESTGKAGDKDWLEHHELEAGAVPRW